MFLCCDVLSLCGVVVVVAMCCVIHFVVLSLSLGCRWRCVVVIDVLLLSLCCVV